MNPRSSAVLQHILMRLASLVPLLLVCGCRAGSDDSLVVYCAHDAVFSQQVLEDFERETGIPVDVKFDTEASKSLGLVNQIIREAAAPRCDVFWNNETLGTIDLARRGLLEPYRGRGYERIPERYKDSEGRWCGFGGRLRVWIVNTNDMEASDQGVKRAFSERLEEFTWAKPLFGTTLTHYCVLAAELGVEKLKRLDERLRSEATLAASNGQTRDLVAAGTCAFGWTDTDDYFGAHDGGKPVSMVPVRVEGRTICIPNSVAIVKGTKRRPQAERLTDYLLSRDVEVRLARSESRQIPLGDVGDADIPDEVRGLVPYAAEGIDLASAAGVREDVLRWLTATYAN